MKVGDGWLSLAVVDIVAEIGPWRPRGACELHVRKREPSTCDDAYVVYVQCSPWDHRLPRLLQARDEAAGVARSELELWLGGLGQPHLDCIMIASRLNHDCIETASRLHRDCTMIASRLYHDCIETAS